LDFSLLSDESTSAEGVTLAVSPAPEVAVSIHPEEPRLKDFDAFQETLGTFVSESVCASGLVSDPEKWPDSVQGE
jgi:hypothetical protein